MWSSRTEYETATPITSRAASRVSSRDARRGRPVERAVHRHSAPGTANALVLNHLPATSSRVATSTGAHGAPSDPLTCAASSGAVRVPPRIMAKSTFCTIRPSAMAGCSEQWVSSPAEMESSSGFEQSMDVTATRFGWPLATTAPAVFSAGIAPPTAIVPSTLPTARAFRDAAAGDGVLDGLAGRRGLVAQVRPLNDLDLRVRVDDRLEHRHVPGEAVAVERVGDVAPQDDDRAALARPVITARGLELVDDRRTGQAPAATLSKATKGAVCPGTVRLCTTTGVLLPSSCLSWATMDSPRHGTRLTPSMP